MLAIVREDYHLMMVYSADMMQKNVNTIKPLGTEMDENGFAKRDTTLQHPRCVWNLLKQHVSRYA